MFQLHTTLGYTRAELYSTGQPLHEVEATYSNLEPGVVVKLNFGPKMRARFGDAAAVKVTADSLDKIRGWLTAVDIYQNGGAVSMGEVEEMSDEMDKFMEQVLNDSHPDGHVMFRE